MTRSSRSRAAGAVALGVLLVGCATAPTAEPAASGGADGGADGRVVVALDDFAALTAMSLGVQPDLVLEVFGYTTTSAVLDDAGVPTEPYGSALDLERIVAAAPDVVLGVSIPTTVEVQEQLSGIAPATVLDYTAGWQEQLTTAADALGVPDRAAALRERLDADVATLAADLTAAGLAGSVVSVLGEVDQTFSPPPSTPAGTVLAGAGLARPAAQQQAGTPDSPFVLVSGESLGDHGGDVVYLLSGGGYATGPITGSPLWPQVAAGAQGRTFDVSAETWLGSSAFSIDWIIRDVRATLLDSAPPASDAEAPERFRAFVDSAGAPQQ